jgi:hypothetical protein
MRVCNSSDFAMSFLVLTSFWVNPQSAIAPLTGGATLFRVKCGLINSVAYALTIGKTSRISPAVVLLIFF